MLVEIFNDPDLCDQLAVRGGTALNKLFLRPASRYSEDIDLVQTKPGPIGVVLDAIRARVDCLLGRPRRDHSQGNTTLLYRFNSEIPPVTPLRLKIEINTREHFTVHGFKRVPLSVTNGWFSGKADVTTYAIEEILGTKLRALYQRRKGRDLFDLWLCVERNMADPDKIVATFSRYMEEGGKAVSRAEFEANLYAKRDDPAFLRDIGPLLTPDIMFDPNTAFQIVHRQIISRLPGKPWRQAGHDRGRAWQ